MDQGETTANPDAQGDPAAAAAKQALSDHSQALQGKGSATDKGAGNGNGATTDKGVGADGNTPAYDVGAKFNTDAVSISDDTLKLEAIQLRKSVGNLDMQSTLNLILTTPRQNRADLERQYQALTDHSLRHDLHTFGMDDAGKALDSKSPTDDAAARLSSDIKNLSRLGQNDVQRGPVEKDLRDSIRTLNGEQLKVLDASFKAESGGKGLKELLSDGHISQPSRQALEIYQKGSDQLSADDRLKIAQIATTPPLSQKQISLDLLTASLAGDDGADARQKFRAAGGNDRASALFRGDDLSQAQNLIAFGSDAPTRAREYQSSVGAHKGMENVLTHMTDSEHQMFDRGEHLALSAFKQKKTFDNQKDQEAYDFYQKMHYALSDSTIEGLGPTTWGDPQKGARLAHLDEWEDLAAHGQRTLIGRLAAQRNSFLPDDPSKFITTLHSGNSEDWAYMHNDPVYQAKMQKLVNQLDYSDRLLINREIDHVYTDSANPKEFEQNKKLQLEDLNRSFGFKKADDVTVMSTISKSTAGEWQSMSGQDQGLLKQRVGLLADGPKQATEAMLAALDRGENPKPGLKEQIYIDQLRGKNPMAIAHDLEDAAQKDPGLFDRLQAGQEAGLEKAIRSAMGSDLVYQKYGKPLIENKGLSMANIIEANTERGISNRVNAAAVYNDISLLTAADRQKLVQAQAQAQDKEVQAKTYLDSALAGLSPEQRKIALGIASNTDGRPSLADRMRASINGDDKNLSSDITDLEAKDRGAKVGAVAEYSRKYGSFMIADLSNKGSTDDKAALTRALPIPIADLYQVHQQALKDASVGIISHSNMRNQSDKLTEAYRHSNATGLADDESSIIGILNDSSTAVRDHQAAKEEKAEKVAEKIVEAASLAVPIGGMGVRGVLYAAAAGAAMRPMVEEAVTGKHIEGPQMAGLLVGGAIDGGLAVLGPAEVKGIAERLTTGTFKGLRQCLAETAAKDALSREAINSLEQSVKHEMVTKGSVSTAELDRLVGQHVSDPEKRRVVVVAIESEHARAEKVEELNQAKATLVPKLMKDAKVTDKLRPPLEDISGQPPINPFKGKSNCTACVGATLRSAAEGKVSDVNAIYDLPKGTGKLGEPVPGKSFSDQGDAVQYMEQAAGLKSKGLKEINLPKSERAVPDLSKLPPGHYAVTFNLNAAERADRHVIYAEKMGDGSIYFYDPQSHQVYDPKLVKAILSPASADLDRFPQFYRADMPGSAVPESLADTVPGKVAPDEYAHWMRPPQDVAVNSPCRPEMWAKMSNAQRASMEEMNVLRSKGQLAAVSDSQFEGLSMEWDRRKNLPKWQGDEGKKAFADWYLTQVRAQ